MSLKNSFDRHLDRIPINSTTSRPGIRARNGWILAFGAGWTSVCGLTRSRSTSDFAAGEYMRTEVSAKFRLERFAAELAAVGLHVEHWFTDSAGDYGVSLSVLR